jgi:hypothetical protein
MTGRRRAGALWPVFRIRESGLETSQHVRPAGVDLDVYLMTPWLAA